jgi:hypothetical protein
MAGKDLDAVPELDQPAEAVEEALGSFPCLDRKVRTSRVAHEERIAGENEPRLVAPRAIDRREAAVLGTVTRRVDRPQHDLADLDLRTVLERLVHEGGTGLPVDPNR